LEELQAMSKATLMVRFKGPSDPTWIRRLAVYGTTGRVCSGFAEFEDPKTGQKSIEAIGENFPFEIRVEDGGTTCKPAGKKAADAEAKRLQIAVKLQARMQTKAAGLLVVDPAEEARGRLRLADAFDDYIEDALKRGALEAREQAILVKAEFLELVSVNFADEVTRDRILSFDAALRERGRVNRTIANKRQRLQSMLRWAGVDPKIFPPKPKFEKKLPSIYAPDELAGLFRMANPYEATFFNLALKLGLRDREVQHAEFHDISWHESVFRVRSKPEYHFTIKDYEQREIPIPLDFLDELKAWKEEHRGQSLIVPTAKGNPNRKLLVMTKRVL
jgi:integrase